MVGDGDCGILKTPGFTPPHFAAVGLATLRIASARDFAIGVYLPRFQAEFTVGSGCVYRGNNVRFGSKGDKPANG